MVASEALRHPSAERVEPGDDGDFSLRVWFVGAESPWVMYLGNIFHETRESSPTQRLERVRRFLTALHQREEDLDWDEAAVVLVPLVRMLSFGELTFEPLSRPFLPFVRVFVGIDREETISIVSKVQVQKWKQDPATVFAAALDTLSNHITESDVEVYDADVAYRVWHITRDDSYESSRLALPGFLASFYGKVAGNPIAIVPARSTLIVSGDADVDAVGRLGRTAQSEFNASPRAISPAVYTTDPEGRVVPLHLPEAHPHYQLLERGHRLLATTCYAEQKEAVERQFEEKGVDIFVASLGAFEEKATGAVKTWASMAEGVDTLLPEADLIVIGCGQPQTGWSAMVPWATVFALAPECFEQEPSMDPPRWRVVGWPSTDVLAKLRAAAVP